MTLRLLNCLRLSGRKASGTVGMRECLRSGDGSGTSCDKRRRRREDERRSKTFAVTGAQVDEWSRESCMAESVAWT